MTETTALVDLKGRPLADVFKPEVMDQMIQEIRAKAEAHVPDITTAAGRKAIASNAQNVARSKTFLDGKGKELVADIKKQTALVDAERRKLRDACDKIKADVRRPLTEWEEEDKIFRSKSELELQFIRTSHSFDMTEVEPQKITELIDQVRAINPEELHKDVQEHATNAKEVAISVLRDKLAQRMQYDADQAELAKLRRQREEQEAKELERRRQEEAEKAEQERQEAAKRAEQERIEREAQIRKEAEERAEEEKAAAIKAERERVKAKKLADEAKERRRQENVAHRKKIENEAFISLQSYCASACIEVTDQVVMNILTAISNGHIDNVKIEY